MAGKKENLKALFANTRTRVIILFTAGLFLATIVFGIVKFIGMSTSAPKSVASLNVGPAGIESVPGSINPTAQYASLQQKQNIDQAKVAAKTGSSAIPTIIRAEAFGQGVERVGPQHGSGGVGFSTLAQEYSAGPQQSLWLQALRDGNCSKASINKVVTQGAALTDLKQACSCVQLKDFGYKLTDLESVCSCKNLKAAGYNATELKQTGYSASRLRDCGFDACEVRGAGFTAQEMKDAGFSDGELKGAGFSDIEIIRASGLPDNVSAADVLKAGCGVAGLSHLRSEDVSAAAIRRISGCSSSQLKAGGYSALELRNAGFSAADLKNAGFTAEQLRQAGFTARELLNAGFNPAELLAAGFTKSQLKAAEAEFPPTMTSDDIKEAGCNDGAIKRERLAGVSALLIHQYAGCSAEELKDGGFTAADLDLAGFTPDQIKALFQGVSDADVRAAGCNENKLHQLYNSGVSARRIHELNGCSAIALKRAGFSLGDLVNAGFTSQDLLAAGFTPDQIKKAELDNAAANQGVSDADVRAASCNVNKLHQLFNEGVSAKRIHTLNGCNADILKKAGFSLGDLVSAGFTSQELLAAGFTPEQIKKAELAYAAAIRGVSDTDVRAAGCNTDKLHQLFNEGVSATRIHALNGCSADVLKKAGFSLGDLINAGFTPQELQAAGFTPDQIKKAELANDAAILAAGCDSEKLHQLYLKGFSAKRIHELNGCSADALKNAGFIPMGTEKGVSDADVRAAACNVEKLHKLFTQGVSAARIHTLNGCSAETLRKAGYGAKDLADAGFTPQELLAAGFTSEQLARVGLNPAGVLAAGRTANCSVASLKAAHALNVAATTLVKTLGCSAKQLAEGGYSVDDLKNAGFTAAELKDAGFSAAELKKAGFSAKELAAAGFSAQQLKDAGYSLKQLKEAGFSAADLKKLGYTASQLKDIGFTAKELKEAGFSAAELRAAGFTAKELKDAGFTAHQLREAKFSAGDLRAAGFDSSELRSAGYSQQELQNAGFTEQQSSMAGLGAPSANPALPSAVGTLPSVGGSRLDRLRAAEAANAQNLQKIIARQKVQMADQRYQQKIQQRETSMLSEANTLRNTWKQVSGQAYVGGTRVEKVKGRELGVVAGVSQYQEVPHGHKGAVIANQNKPALIKAGDVLFAVIDTSVNSDEPGPILATIVSGKFNGTKLIGSFTLPANADKMIISFNTMSVPGAEKTTSINAYAIDPNTARTALASRTNHHYLLRYGSLFASTFIEGFGNAFQSANTTITIGGTGGMTNTTVQNGVGRSVLENAVIGLATLGKTWGQVAMQQFSLPTTVEVYSGTGLGILFTQDVRSL